MILAVAAALTVLHHLLLPVPEGAPFYSSFLNGSHAVKSTAQYSGQSPALQSVSLSESYSKILARTQVPEISNSIRRFTILT
jgi:hypothetical protein